MDFMVGGGLGGEAGAAGRGPLGLLPGMPPNAGRWNSPSGAMSGKGAHKQTHPGKHGDKGQPDATSIPQGFLNFHRPKKPTLVRHA